MKATLTSHRIMSPEASRMQRPEGKEKGFEMILSMVKLIQSL